MNKLLAQNTIFVKERVSFFKAANAYDLLDPTTGKSIGLVQEKVAGRLAKIFKFTKYKTLTPFTVDIMDESGQRLVTLTRPFTLLRSRVTVLGSDGEKLGYFAQGFGWGTKFKVFGPDGAQAGNLNGDWKGWNFTIVDTQGLRLASVTKKWAGIGKEFFTSADQYVVDMDPAVKQEGTRKLILAAAICIDMVLHEHGR